MAFKLIPAGLVVGPITDTDILYYDPEPGAGNLIASISGTGGTDEYGNTYPAGVATDGTGTFLNWYAALSGNALVLHPGPGGGTNGHVSISTSGPGYQANIFSPSAAADNPASLILQSELAAGIGSPLAILDQPLQVDSVVAIVSGTPETWHPVTVPAGWTGTARVKMLAENKIAVLDLSNVAIATNPSATASFGALPSAAYYPLAGRSYPLALSGGNAGTDTRININASPTGPTLAGLPTGVSFSIGQMFDYPLD